MGLSEEIRQKLINSFKTEQREHIQEISQGLLALENNPGRDERQALLQKIFREAHSLKGAARAVGLPTIESIGHALEDLLMRAKEGSRPDFSPELFDLMYQALDAVELVMAGLERGDSTPPAKVLALLARLEEVREIEVSPTPERFDREEPERELAHQPASEEKQSPAPLQVGQEPEPETSAQAEMLQSQTPEPTTMADETIRVSVSKLDALMAQFSELLGAKIRSEQRLTEVRELQSLATEWHKDWLAVRNHYTRLARHDGPAAFQDNSPLTGNDPGKEVRALVHFATRNRERLRSFSSQANTLYRQLANDTMRLSLIIDELQEEIKRVRMLPLATITPTLGRMVRDLARAQDKQITLMITGGETELDKRVLEQIKDPLIHLLRNAVDHGIEWPAEREAAGKPAEGQIVLTASQQGHNVVITVRDDGAGLDLDAIRAAAVRRGGSIQSGDVQTLNNDEVVRLIFYSGLSTSQIITDISGRGVGLDVVRQNIEELHGTLDVSFEPKRGTTFTMSLPLTLASSRGLLVKAGGQIFALPLSTVERMLQVKEDALASIEDRAAFSYQQKPIALVWLADLLELPRSARDPDQLTVVIVAVAEKRLGIIVDELVGEQEIVIKSLGKQLVRIGGIAGATVLGSGQVILVLHTADLIKLAIRSPGRVRGKTDSRKCETNNRKTILVVDDSITTRTLEKNILEAAGYEVILATDGEQALATLVTDSLPDLVVSDIKMPRLDGFGLTQRIRQEARYANIPVILVTSLDSPADKARGIEVGADAYIVKSSFDQNNLLETIGQLV